MSLKTARSMFIICLKIIFKNPERSDAQIYLQIAIEVLPLGNS